MNKHFFKTNWFYIALGILLLMYALRKFPALNPFNGTGKKSPQERLTQQKNARKGGASLLGFIPDAPKEPASDPEGITALKAEAFLKRFANVALSESKKFGIPASVILACAYANSQAGQLETAIASNNFFCLPCTDGWEGETLETGGRCVRKYESAWAGFRDFSIYLSSQEWCAALKKSAGKEGKKWAEKLGDKGLANTQTMLKVMEGYNLEELDAL